MRKISLFLILAFLIVQNSFSQTEQFIIENGPYIQAVADNSATIVWTTNREGVAWVEIAPDDESHFYAYERKKFFHTIFGQKNIGRVHKVVVDDLEPNSRYRYRIFTQEVKNRQAYSFEYGSVASTSVFKTEPLSFKTLNSQSTTANFLMINDIHANENLLASLVGNENVEKCDFVVFNGDMMTHLNSERELFNGFLAKATELFAKTTPMFFVRGNHETRGNFAVNFLDYFPTTSSKPYYAFRQGPAFFLVLDPGEDKPDSDIEYHGLADFDKYRIDEAKWLKEVVQSKEFQESPIKIVLIHIPPMGGKWHGNLELNRLFMPILNEANISLMLCGHEHEYRYTKRGEGGAQFPMIVNSNKHSLFVEIEQAKIKVRIKDENGGVVRDFTIE